MPNPTFELFEHICLELLDLEQSVITDRAFSGSLLQDLQKRYKKLEPEPAIRAALDDLTSHFHRKNARLPFSYDTRTWVFKREDEAFIRFISEVSNIRNDKGKNALKFQVTTCERLSHRLTGDLYRVGWPSLKKTKKKQLVELLTTLGFDKDVLEPEDKDGGLDIIWLPPLGTIPLRPIASVQCKNTSFSMDEANKSVGKSERSIARHSHLRSGGVYLSFAVFNDYIDESFNRKIRGCKFVPLGLSDLAALAQAAPVIGLH
jgi:hypothetical protein